LTGSGNSLISKARGLNLLRVSLLAKENRGSNIQEGELGTLTELGTFDKDSECRPKTRHPSLHKEDSFAHRPRVAADSWCSVQCRKKFKIIFFWHKDGSPLYPLGMNPRNQKSKPRDLSALVISH
jgi:hypothetical protein